MVGRRGDGERVVADDPRRPRRRARQARAASAGSARASASTPCGSSATPATSSRSARSTRSTRSTSPTPRSRRVLGELKIPGYSAYLHPIGDDLLLGIGQDATTRGGAARDAALALRRLRPAAPTPLARAPLGQGWSEAEADHHAFLCWPQDGPRRRPGGHVRRPAVRRRTRPARAPLRGITEVGRVSHPAASGPTLSARGAHRFGARW